MVRARSFANVTACSTVMNPAGCRIFREISCFFPLNIGTLFRGCVLRQGTLPSHASPDSSVNEYLVGQRWQWVRLAPIAPKWLHVLYAPKKGVEMVHEWTGSVTRGNMCEAHRALRVSMRHGKPGKFQFYFPGLEKCQNSWKTHGKNICQ